MARVCPSVYSTQRDFQIPTVMPAYTAAAMRIHNQNYCKRSSSMLTHNHATLHNMTHNSPQALARNSKRRWRWWSEFQRSSGEQGNSQRRHTEAGTKVGAPAHRRPRQRSKPRDKNLPFLELQTRLKVPSWTTGFPLKPTLLPPRLHLAPFSSSAHTAQSVSLLPPPPFAARSDFVAAKCNPRSREGPDAKSTAWQETILSTMQTVQQQEQEQAQEQEQHNKHQRQGALC